MAPSSTKGAVIARCRRPPTKVIVFQCPCVVDEPCATRSTAAQPHHRGVRAGFDDEPPALTWCRSPLSARRPRHVADRHPESPRRGHRPVVLLVSRGDFPTARKLVMSYGRVRCEQCNGSGWYGGHKCYECGGQGYRHEAPPPDDRPKRRADRRPRNPAPKPAPPEKR